MQILSRISFILKISTLISYIHSGYSDETEYMYYHQPERKKVDYLKYVDRIICEKDLEEKSNYEKMVRESFKHWPAYEKPLKNLSKDSGYSMFISDPFTPNKVNNNENSFNSRIRRRANNPKASKIHRRKSKVYIMYDDDKIEQMCTIFDNGKYKTIEYNHLAESEEDETNYKDMYLYGLCKNNTQYNTNYNNLNSKWMEAKESAIYFLLHICLYSKEEHRSLLERNYMESDNTGLFFRNLKKDEHFEQFAKINPNENFVFSRYLNKEKEVASKTENKEEDKDEESCKDSEKNVSINKCQCNLETFSDGEGQKLFEKNSIIDEIYESESDFEGNESTNEDENEILSINNRIKETVKEIRDIDAIFEVIQKELKKNEELRNDSIAVLNDSIKGKIDESLTFIFNLKRFCDNYFDTCNKVYNVDIEETEKLLNKHIKDLDSKNETDGEENPSNTDSFDEIEKLRIRFSGLKERMFLRDELQAEYKRLEAIEETLKKIKSGETGLLKIAEIEKSQSHIQTLLEEHNVKYDFPGTNLKIRIVGLYDKLLIQLNQIILIEKNIIDAQKAMLEEQSHVSSVLDVKETLSKNLVKLNLELYDKENEIQESEPIETSAK